MKKLTARQQTLLDSFNNGERISIVNDQYRFDDGSLVPYRLFWNLMLAIYGPGNKIENEKYFKEVNQIIWRRQRTTEIDGDWNKGRGSRRRIFYGNS